MSRKMQKPPRQEAEAMTQVNPWVVFAIASAAVFLVSVDATIGVAASPALRLAAGSIARVGSAFSPH